MVFPCELLAFRLVGVVDPFKACIRGGSLDFSSCFVVMWKWAPYYTRISIFPCFFFLSSSLPSSEHHCALFPSHLSESLFFYPVFLFLFSSLLFILTPLLSPWLHLPSPTLRLFMLVPSVRNNKLQICDRQGRR